MTHVFNIILYDSIMYFFVVSLLSAWLKLLKHVKPIIFENYNKCKTKHLWGLKEDPISEDLKENPFNEKLKEDLLWNLKTTLSMEILRSFSTLNDFCAAN